MRKLSRKKTVFSVGKKSLPNKEDYKNEGKKDLSPNNNNNNKNFSAFGRKSDFADFTDKMENSDRS